MADAESHAWNSVGFVWVIQPRRGVRKTCNHSAETSSDPVEAVAVRKRHQQTRTDKQEI